MTPREFAIEVVQKLQTAGYQGLWAGGCVRDSLLGREPKDYDVATSATPDQIRELFGHRRTLPIGAAFGVISVIGPRGFDPIEVATFRRDGGYSDGRRPDSIEFTDAREDALRRDFTINGMFFDPLLDDVIDYVGGQDDLNAKVVRAIGDPAARIEEDKLRMLRGVRFAATFDFSIEPATQSAIQSCAEQIKVVSAERIGQEVRRMLSHGSRLRAASLLLETNLLAQIVPAVEGDRFDACVLRARGLKQLEQLADDRFETVVLALLEPLFGDGMDARKAVRFSGLLQSAWRLPNDQQKSLAWLASHWRELHRATRVPWPQIQRLLIHADTPSALDLAAAIAGPSEGLEFCRERLGWSAERLNPQPLVDGGVLIKQGVAPGPKFKAILHRVRDAQLDGSIETQAEAIALALTLARTPADSG